MTQFLDDALPEERKVGMDGSDRVVGWIRDHAMAYVITAALNERGVRGAPDGT